jgi:hypothetical protein
MIIDPEQIRAARERLRETCNYTRPATRMPRALVYCALLFMGLGFMCGLASEARSTFSLLPEPSFSLLGDTPAAKGAMEQATDFLRTPSPAKRTTNGPAVAKAMVALDITLIIKTPSLIERKQPCQ